MNCDKKCTVLSYSKEKVGRVPCQRLNIEDAVKTIVKVVNSSAKEIVKVTTKPKRMLVLTLCWPPGDL